MKKLLFSNFLKSISHPLFQQKLSQNGVGKQTISKDEKSTASHKPSEQSSQMSSMFWSIDSFKDHSARHSPNSSGSSSTHYPSSSPPPQSSFCHSENQPAVRAGVLLDWVVGDPLASSTSSSQSERTNNQIPNLEFDQTEMEEKSSRLVGRETHMVNSQIAKGQNCETKLIGKGINRQSRTVSPVTTRRREMKKGYRTSNEQSRSLRPIHKVTLNRPSIDDNSHRPNSLVCISNDDGMRNSNPHLHHKTNRRRLFHKKKDSKSQLGNVNPLYSLDLICNDFVDTHEPSPTNSYSAQMMEGIQSKLNEYPHRNHIQTMANPKSKDSDDSTTETETSSSSSSPKHFWVSTPE
jgi:hypothetical protein